MDSGDDRQRPRRIVVNGPLAASADGLRRELAGQGYALDTVGDHVHLLADLSGWLGSQDLSGEDLTTQKVEEFLRDRPRCWVATGFALWKSLDRGCGAGLIEGRLRLPGN